MNLKEKQDERNRIWQAQKALTDRASKENRGLTAEEQRQWDKADDDFERLSREIEMERRESFMNQSANSPILPDPNAFLTKPAAVLGANEMRLVRPGDAYPVPVSPKGEIEAWGNYLTRGYVGLREGERDTLERRAMQADLDASGGYLVAPEQFSATVITRLQNTVALRPLCTIIQVPKAASVGVPAFDDTPVAASWTSELSIGSEQSIEFAKRELTPHPLATYCKASKKLIRLATTDVSAFIAEQLSYGFAVAEEQAFMTGTGVAQPLGLFTASAMGIGTDRDVSTDNTATQIRADNLIEVCHTLKSQYRSSKSCRWIFSRTAVKQIRKLKDGSGDYLWKMGLAAGNPSTILDIPYIESEYAPATFTSGQYVGILGDLRFFYVADSLDFEIQVLTELYAANNQNGYIARRETDGMPVLSEAFVRVKLG